MASNKSAAPGRKRNSGDAVVVTFFSIIIAICYYIVMYRLFSRADTFLALHGVLKVLRWVFLGFAAALAVLAVKARRDGKELAPRRFGWGAFIALMLDLSFFLMTFYYLDGAKLACIAFITLAVLRLIYLIYGWEFTFAAIEFAAAEIALYLKIYYYGILAYIAVALAVLVIFAVFEVELVAKHHGGRLVVKEHRYYVLRKNTKYFITFLSAALSVIAIAAGLVSSVIGFYAMIALACVAFVYIVYYTVKLM